MKNRLLTAVLMTVLMGTTAAADTLIPDDLWDYTEDVGDALIILNFKEVELAIPAEWEGLYGIETGEDYVEFYQQASRDIARAEGVDGGGVLFNIIYSQDYDFMEYMPNYHIVGNGTEGVYYITTPTDVQCLGTDAAVWDEWMMLVEEVDAIIANAVIPFPGEGIVENYIDFELMGEYLLENSSEEYLEESDLEGMNAEQIQMAINEIYARHGRKFVLENVQKYFNDLSWYEGTVEAADFDPTCLNVYEVKNIDLMVKYMNEMPVIPEEGTRVYTEVPLNLRDTASNTGDVICVIPKNTVIIARAEAENGWLPVAYYMENGASAWGFVWEAYVSPVEEIEL